MAVFHAGIRGGLKVKILNSPCGQPTPGQLLSRLVVGRPQGIEWYGKAGFGDT
jgi:hypothetical protein